MRREDIIIRPLLTEKTTKMSEKLNSVSFEVSIKSNKCQIKDAVEKYYGVKVERVNTSVRPGRAKRTAKGQFKSPSTKRAFIILAKDSKIEFFTGA